VDVLVDAVDFESADVIDPPKTTIPLVFTCGADVGNRQGGPRRLHLKKLRP